MRTVDPSNPPTAQDVATRGDRPGPTRNAPLAIRHSAFTLVELVVVVAVILIILGMTLPSVSRMWEQRKASEAETLVQGALMSARDAALYTGKRRGLFFMVDDREQKIFPIEADPYDSTDTTEAGDASEVVAANRYGIADDKVITLPVPYRAAPRAVVDDTVWSEAEIDRTDYAANHDQFERHRNFFTVLFADNGRLIVRENILIRDSDGDDDGDGDRTGLKVNDATKWLAPVPPNGSTTQVLLLGGTLVDMICDDSGSDAINFPSVDGLLVYDDAVFVEQVTRPLKRGYLLDSGQPLYLSRLSGDVIRGPKGESE
ncbi:MAG TPA: prepilin-type N-terminal cleavage/methylation domain-containing protein [Phycisphaerae bacterium]|nr:prepilin-type N-terminal cleavage/methylation domain-containing protein [Phycisphaerae bacterium]